MSSSSASAKLDWDEREIATIKRSFMAGLVKMGFAMRNKAVLNAPVLTGALRNSIRVTEQDNNQVIVRAGGTIGRFVVDYAELREFENNKHPQTKYYMTRAFNSVVEGNINQYFKEIVR